MVYELAGRRKLGHDPFRHGRLAIIVDQRKKAFIEQTRGCFISATLNQLFSTGYYDNSSPLAPVLRKNKIVKACKNLNFRLDRIGRGEGIMAAELKPIDVICQHSRDGKITPMKIRVIDEDGEYQEYKIKGYNIIMRNNIGLKK